MTHAGKGYTTIPTITIIGGGGVGAAATASINTTSNGVIAYTVTDAGDGYGKPAPGITISGGGGSGASAEAVIVDSKLSNIRVLDPGTGYGSNPAVSVANPLAFGGAGNYDYNEEVRGVNSGTIARVKEWDYDTKTLKLSQVGIGTTVSGFIPGEPVEAVESTIFTEYANPTNGDVSAGTTVITGVTTTNVAVGHYFQPIDNVIGVGNSVTQIETNTIYLSHNTLNTSTKYNQDFKIGTRVPVSYSAKVYDDRDIYDSYDSNDEFQDWGDDILDFTQSNPFGNY